MLKIKLAKLGDRGTSASIERDDDGDSVVITELVTRVDAGTVCRASAKKLRRLAERFEELAQEDEPFKSVTQNRVNARKRKR